VPPTFSRFSREDAMQIATKYWERVTELCSRVEPLIALSYQEALKEFNDKHTDTMYLLTKSQTWPRICKLMFGVE
jgi:hypothetical protein